MLFHNLPGIENMWGAKSPCMPYLRSPVSFVSVAAMFLVLWLASCGKDEFANTDLKNYNAVAERFLFNNSIIGRKIGKVERVDHFGVGGDGGEVSYNVYRLNGKNGSAVCYVTLEKDAKLQWKVTKAILAIDGTEYMIPVKRAEKVRKMKLF